MGRIKTRESVKDIKILDKAAVVSERMKTALVRSKDQAENLMDDGQISPSEYAEDKIRYAAEDVTDQVWHEVSGQTKKAIEKGKEAHREHRNEKRIHKNKERVRRYEEELRRGAPSRTPREEAARQAARQNTEATRTSIRSRRNQTIKSAERTERTIKQSARSAGKQTVKAGAKGTVKSTERAVKTAEKTSKAAIKTAEATAKATQKAAAAAAKAAQKAAEIARQTAIAAYKAAVAAAKAIAAAIKAIAAAMKALAAAIAAGGWVAVVVVVVICLVALIACSCFGIFFSSEDTGSEKTMRQVIQEINMDYQNELDAIKDSVESSQQNRHSNLSGKMAEFYRNQSGKPYHPGRPASHTLSGRAGSGILRQHESHDAACVPRCLHPGRCCMGEGDDVLCGGKLPHGRPVFQRGTSRLQSN